MRIARIAHDDAVHHALLRGGHADLIADPFTAPAGEAPLLLGRRVALSRARLLAPVEPRTVVGMAHNTGTADRELPPQAFLKPARSVIGPGDPVPLPADIGRVDAEAELAVVLAESPAGHTEATVHRAVFGYTVANDVTARDLQGADPLWTSAKGHAGFTPLGPWIETGLGPREAADAEVGLALDDGRRGSASTAGLARGVAEILCHLAGYLPLGPGDVVLTGAPGAPRAILPGAHVSVSVAGIGTLTNPVTRRRPPEAPRPLTARTTGGHE